MLPLFFTTELQIMHPLVFSMKKRKISFVFFFVLFAALNGGDVKILERSKREKAWGSSNEDGEMMGGGSEGEEELCYPSNGSRKRFKLNGKVVTCSYKSKSSIFALFSSVILSIFVGFQAFDDYNPVNPSTVPRKLRSGV